MLGSDVPLQWHFDRIAAQRSYLPRICSGQTIAPCEHAWTLKIETRTRLAAHLDLTHAESKAKPNPPFLPSGEAAQVRPRWRSECSADPCNCNITWLRWSKQVSLPRHGHLCRPTGSAAISSRCSPEERFAQAIPERRTARASAWLHRRQSDLIQ